MEKHILKKQSFCSLVLGAEKSSLLGGLFKLVMLTWCALLVACQSVSLSGPDAQGSWGSGSVPAINTGSGIKGGGNSDKSSNSNSTGLSSLSPLSPLANKSLSTSEVMHLSLPNDIWERVRKGFGMPDLQSELVSDREQWYSARPEYLTRMTERSTKYMYYIVDELERRKMPTELALLPFVESAFNPQAVSSARASGMWQFMPQTGKTFDLKQNAFRDDRRDVMASTRAALDYLQKLYTQFGDWQLALAAYNWGEGNVGKSIAKNQRLGLGVSYSELTMPMETRFYVPKLQAVKNIIANPQNFQVNLANIPNHPYFQSVPLLRDIDVSLVSKLAEIPVEDFKALNPSANRPVLLAAGTPQILLPWDNAEIFQKNYDNFTGSKLASWTAWIAPKTLKVADAAQLLGLKEDELRALNNIPPKMMIKAGSALLIPRGAKKDEDVSFSIAEQGQLDLSPEQFGKKISHKISTKDTWQSIAAKYHVSTKEIALWNNLSVNQQLKVGQTLSLFVNTKSSAKKKSPVKSDADKRNVKTHAEASPKKSAHKKS